MKKSYTLIIISLVSVAVVLLSAAITLFVVTSGKQVQDEIAATKDTAALTEAQEVITEAPRTGTESSDPTQTAAAETAAETSADSGEVKAPDELISLLSRYGMTPQQLSDTGCGQLVTVDSSGSSAKIRFFSKEGNTWTADDALTCSGYVGRNGVTSDMHEGGFASPYGLYPIGDAFYIYDQPATGLNSFRITSDTYWVDDPDSAHYNQHMEGTSQKDWSSAEHMIDYDVYRYGFVVDYNTAAEYNKGSAIFFHISYNPTAGCIGTDEASVLDYLSKLSASARPYILIL